MNLKENNIHYCQDVSLTSKHYYFREAECAEGKSWPFFSVLKITLYIYFFVVVVVHWF